MSADLLTKDLITYDPLSPTTRKERTALLGVSMLGVALVKVPLVPERFTALGVDFGAVQQATLVQLYAVLVAFYVVAFCLYAATDYVAWRRQEVITLHEYNHQVLTRQLGSGMLADLTKVESVRAPVDLPAYQGLASYQAAFRAARSRAAFEFLLPIAFAGYALYSLAIYKP